MGDDIHEVGSDEREALIAWLGDLPETVASVHRLRRGTGRALVAGPVDRPEAAVVLPSPTSTWPAGFGDDPERLWALLARVEGWEAIHVPLAMGGRMAAVVEQGAGSPPELIEELYFLADGPVRIPEHAEVRLLTPADIPLMDAATEALGMDGWRLGSAGSLMAEGIVSGAVVGGELVAVGFTSCWSERFAEVGIVTRDDHRNRGLSTAAGALVCGEIERAGRTPVWSTSEQNVASRRVAAKLGFREVSRRVYVNRA